MTVKLLKLYFEDNIEHVYIFSQFEVSCVSNLNSTAKSEKVEHREPRAF